MSNALLVSMTRPLTRYRLGVRLNNPSPLQFCGVQVNYSAGVAKLKRSPGGMGGGMSRLHVPAVLYAAKRLAKADAMQWIYRVKTLIPPGLWRAVTGPYWWWYNRARHQVAAALSPHRTRSIPVLRSFRDRHRGERCFILGNGPSLRQTDLSLLKNEVSFGMNRIYLLFPELGFGTTYYLSVNTLVVEQCAQEIRALQMPKFITWRARRWLSRDPRVVFLDTDYTPPATFSKEVSGRVFEGSTVTYVAMQLAYHMGFDEVILIGVDHNFSTRGPANVTVVSEGADLNHFAPDYFGKGFRWQLPDLGASEFAYRLAKEAFETNGRRVLDATLGGKLTVFPKVDLGSLF